MFGPDCGVCNNYMQSNSIHTTAYRVNSIGELANCCLLIIYATILAAFYCCLPLPSPEQIDGGAGGSTATPSNCRERERERERVCE